MAKEMSAQNIGSADSSASGSFSSSAKKLAAPKEHKLEKMFNINLGGGKVNISQKAVFAKNMAIMLRSGLNISEALDIIASSSSGYFRKVIMDIYESVSSGNSFSNSLARFPRIFSGMFINTTYAGESSGTLEANFEAIAVQLEKDKELSSKIKQALMYPVIVLVAALVLGLGISFFVLPQIVVLFQGMRTELPLSTRMLIGFADFMRNYGGIFIIFLMVFAIFMAWLLRQKFVKPFTHALALKTPIISGLTRGANLSHFCRNLSLLLQSGISIDRSLKITKDTLSNYYYSKAVEEISSRISKGMSLSDDLRQYQNLFPPMMIKMIMVGERSGQMEDTLTYLSNFYEGDVDTSAKTLTVIIEPILLLFIGAIVAFLVLSIITPIYNVTGNMK
ncbi:MAG: type II secretion system F family protein [Candidatus Falkowbacteria bacterium]